MPHFGLGISIAKRSSVPDVFKAVVKAANWSINPLRASGNKFPTLAPRTLPNGVSNGMYQQNVSNDVVITSGMVTALITTLTNVNVAAVSGAIPGIINFGAVDNIATKLHSSFSSPRNGRPADDASIAPIHYFTGNDFAITLPKTVTTLAQARELLAGTVIRYQLATPIDTLNTPFINPIIDLSGVLGKNLFDGFLESGGYNTSTGEKLVNASLIRSVLKQSIQPNTQYTLKGVGQINQIRVFEYNSSGAYVKSTLLPLGGQFTSDSSSSFVTFHTLEISLTQFQLELGSVATTYAPYGKANGLLSNFGGTGTSGLTLEPFVTDNVGDEVNVVNLLGNDGNMVDSNLDNRADGWTYSNVTAVSCIGNEVVYLPSAQYGNIGKTTEVRAQNLGDILYFCAFVKANRTQVNLQFYTGVSFPKKNHSGSGNYEFLSTQGSLDSKTTSYTIIADEGTSGFTNITVKQAHLINMTQVFPNASSRPTQAQMDAIMQQLIAKYGYVNTRLIRLAWRVGLKGDGTDDVVVFGSNAPNPVGTQDFAFGFVFKTGVRSTVNWQTVIARLTSISNDAQYALFAEPNQAGLKGFELRIGGTQYTFSRGDVLDNSFYKVVFKRLSGALTVSVNALEKLNVSNSANLVSRPNPSMMAHKSTGETYTSFSNITLFEAQYDDTNIADWEKKFDKYVKATYDLPADPVQLMTLDGDTLQDSNGFDLHGQGQ